MTTDTITDLKKVERAYDTMQYCVFNVQ